MQMKCFQIHAKEVTRQQIMDVKARVRIKKQLEKQKWEINMRLFSGVLCVLCNIVTLCGL